MNAITVLRGATPPAAFDAVANIPDMTGAMQKGLSAGFAAIGYKNSTWRIKHRGEDTPIRDAQGAPMPFLNVVIIGVSENISKQFYAKNYTEGDNEAPDCFSIDGVHPDPSSPQLQCASCAACPQNIWGSRITEKNKKAKACRDTRRIAIVPYGNIANEAFGGPMLLRVPTMSLQNLASYANELKRFGAQPFMVNTQLSFDLQASHPMINFQATGYLDDGQATEVVDMLQNPLIERILHSDVETTADPEGEAIAESVAPLAGQTPPAAFTQAQQPTPTPTPPPPPPPPAPAPAPTPPPPPPPPPPAPAAAAPVPPAAARPTPFTQPAAAPANAATPGFGGPRPPATVTQFPVPPQAPAVAQAPAPAPAPMQATQQALSTPATGPAAVVSGAPPDMAAAIDSLLDSDD